MQNSGAGVSCLVTIIYLIITIIMIIGIWKVFVKAGKPGWGSIIPIYNFIILLQIAKKPVWWILLLFIPIVNLIILILMDLAIAEQFGKGAGFAVGLMLLPFIFFPMLGFGDAQYS